MSRPARLCSNCLSVVPNGQRCACQVASTRARNRRHDARRPSSSARGYNAEWRRKSREWLHYHPTCAFCGNTATLVDHIQPHKGDPVLFWSWRNWQSLCTGCHSRAKQRIERAAASAEAAHV